MILEFGKGGILPGGGGGTLIFSHIRKLWSFFRVQNFEFQYFHKIGLYLVVISMHFFSQGQGTESGLPKFQIFFGGA